MSELSKEQIAELRQKTIEAIGFQFKGGLELFGMGILSPETMINLIKNYNDQGEQVTQIPNPAGIVTKR